MSIVKTLLSATALVVAPDVAAAEADPLFSGIFSDHAVLQRDRPITLWGRTTPGKSVVLSIQGRSVSVTADVKGEWRATMPALPAGGPYVLTATSGSVSQTLSDIMVGDVFLCGGQSNMEFQARFSSAAFMGLSYSPDPMLRYTEIQNDSAATPRRHLKRAATWRVIDPTSVGDASAACFYMARSLQRSQQIPIGFIDADWSGTTIENWISGPALKTLAPYAQGVRSVELLGRDPVAARRAEAQRSDSWWRVNDQQFRTTSSWSSPTFNDATWKTSQFATGWRSIGAPELAAFEGVLWLRTTVILTAEQAANADRLTLGPIDKFDTVWINGQWAGASGNNWFGRDYAIPSRALKAGGNVIAVRILGSNGMLGGTAARNILLADGTAVPISGPWSYHTGAAMSGLEPPVPAWQVPSSYSTMYNAMVAPIAEYGFKLVAWYQGESNIDQAQRYNDLLPLLFADWRRATTQSDLPFVVAQLALLGAPSIKPEETPVAALRDVQARVVRNDPHAGLAVTLDLGDRWDIHPGEKMMVGERLARAARSVAYGGTAVPGGPEVIKVTRAGADLVVTFRYATGGLRTYSSDAAIGFEACVRQACRYVTGRVDGERVVLSGANANDVDRVRYAWASAPYINLYSTDDLPAVPFDWSVS